MKPIAIRLAALAAGVVVSLTALATPLAAGAAPAQPLHKAAVSAQSAGGWQQRDGNTYYYNAQNQLVKGYFRVDGKRYYAHRDTGIVVTKRGWFTRHDKREVYAGKGGVIAAGVIKAGGKMHYVNKFGLLQKGHFKAGGKWYLAVDGVLKKGWVTYKNRKYYTSPKGWLYTGTQTIKGKAYTFNAKGVLQGDTLTVTRNGKKVSGPAETVLARIVMAEVGGFRNDEVYKAQAVAAHSWLLYQYSKGVRYPSVPDATPTGQCKAAVAKVVGQSLSYGGKNAFTPYYAISNGQTNNCSDFWKESYPYLRSVNSSHDLQATGYKATKAIPLDEFRAIMDEVYGPGTYQLGPDPETWIETTTNSAGYVTRVTVGGRSPSVEYFYQSIVGIRSPAFTVKCTGNALVFTTLGWGHGVGMSQWGAYFMATREGQSYAQILAHYYPGTKLMK